MRASGWQIFLAMLRLPLIAWHLGRAGTLGHMAQVTLLPAWMRRFCSLVDSLIRSRGARHDAGSALAEALIRLGPGFIKFGQALSTRADLIGPQMAHSLSLLQDRLPAFAPDLARRQVASEAGCPIDGIFRRFDDVPVAAASIAQVHYAELIDGRQVAVKLLRPGIRRRMQSDTTLFYSLARILEWLAPNMQRLKLVTAVDQFTQISDFELDLRLEAAGAGKLAENMADDEGIHVPWVDLEHTTTAMLVIEWIEGIRIDDVDALTAAGHDIERITEVAARCFFNQVFRDGFFHADMHPGNIFIAADGTLVPIDFGIMGHIDEYTRRVYAEILFGFIKRDYKRVAQVHFEAGYVPQDQDVDEFARALRAVGEPIFGMDASNISMGRLLSYLIEVTERFGMETRTELILLQRTMVVVEGVARSLNPQINIWEVARPIVEGYIKSNLGPAAVLNDLTTTLKVLARFGPRLPSLVEQALIKQSNPEPQIVKRSWNGSLKPFGLGFIFACAAILVLLLCIPIDFN